MRNILYYYRKASICGFWNFTRNILSRTLYFIGIFPPLQFAGFQNIRYIIAQLFVYKRTTINNILLIYIL